MSESLLLTEAERLRFMRYCEQNAASYAGLAEQMGKMPSNPAFDAVTKLHRTKAAAYAFIARELRDTESASIGPSDLSSAPTGEAK